MRGVKELKSMAKGHLFASCCWRWIQKKQSWRKSVNFMTKEGIEIANLLGQSHFVHDSWSLLRLSSVRKSLQQFLWKIARWFEFPLSSLHSNWSLTSIMLCAFKRAQPKCTQALFLANCKMSQFVIWSAKVIFQLQTRFACFTSTTPLACFHFHTNYERFSTRNQIEIRNEKTFRRIN